ncbi:MAG: FGGY family carbohydrate kinase [Acidimicrobiales bacterium]
MEHRVLAIDLGSSSVRAIVYEAGAAGLLPVTGALARRPRHVSGREPGEATFGARSYFADLVACVDELSDNGHLRGITDVALACQWHSLLAVDGSGSPLGPVLTWADTRARTVPGQSVPSPGALEDLRQRTGCAFNPMYWTCRAPWLKEHGTGPGARFLGLSEYVGLRLLDDMSMSASMASGTGLLGTVTRDWDGEALELATVTAKSLPPLAADDWSGRLSAGWRRRWPALAEAAWHPALGDGAAANLGAGCESPERAAVTVGTSAAVRAVQPAPVGQVLPPLPAGLWRYCADAGRAVVGAAYSAGGQLYSWALSLWEGRSATELRFDVEVPVGAGSDGVVVLPWHVGTRPPEPFAPAGHGMVTGLTLSTGGAQIVSAAVEAVCFQLASGLHALEEAAGLPLKVVANGGAVERSEFWRRRLAAALGRPVTYLAATETTAEGAAAAAIGAQARPEGAVFEPSQDDVEALAKVRQVWQQRYRELFPSTAEHG